MNVEGVSKGQTYTLLIKHNITGPVSRVFCLAAGLVGRRSAQRVKLHSLQESAMKKELDDMEAIMIQLEARAGITVLQNPLSGDSQLPCFTSTAV